MLQKSYKTKTGEGGYRRDGWIFVLP